MAALAAPRLKGTEYRVAIEETTKPVSHRTLGLAMMAEEAESGIHRNWLTVVGVLSCLLLLSIRFRHALRRIITRG